MEEEIKLLQVGDVLFDYFKWSGMDKMTIDRVTAKRAFSKSDQFEREIKTLSNPKDSLQVKRIGEYGYAQLSTPELEQKFLIEKTVNKAHSLWSKFNYTSNIKDMDTATKVIDFINSLTPAAIKL